MVPLDDRRFAGRNLRARRPRRLTPDTATGHYRAMRVRAVLFAAVMVAIAVTLMREMAIREHLGPGEYVSTSALVVGMLVLGFRAGRRAFARG
jgi:hypothetical protein